MRDSLPLSIHEYLKTCRELAGLCSQNGWIDNETLQVDVLEEQAPCWVLAVSFEEIIMEGAGCIAGRIPCYGRVEVELACDGQVRACRLL